MVLLLKLLHCQFLVFYSVSLFSVLNEFSKLNFLIILILKDRDAQHNISNSEIVNNVGGAIEYVSVGEVTPILTLERNRFMNNGRQLYGNFSTCDSTISVDVQNMQSLYFRVRFFLVIYESLTYFF